MRGPELDRLRTRTWLLGEDAVAQCGAWQVEVVLRNYTSASGSNDRLTLGHEAVRLSGAAVTNLREP
jgi:hypothetical protein